jgi:hypothetical protein
VPGDPRPTRTHFRGAKDDNGQGRRPAPNKTFGLAEGGVHMACCLALRIPLASASRTASEVEDARRYGDQAMQALRRSVAGGFKTREIFRTSPDLEPLHDRDDFQMLLMDLALPADPFAG